MMSTRKTYHWNCRNRTIVLGERTLVMGILNTTPDSFSDGGSFFSSAAAVERALEMVEQGADIIDVGGESTRPGAEPVGVEEEIGRTVPVIRKIREQSDVLISIDTMKSETARQAMDAGADIINDVSAFEGDEKMAEVAVETSAGVVLMHIKGTPSMMQDHPAYDNVVQEVGAFLQARTQVALNRGVNLNQIVIDPGIGFGKTAGHNVELLQNLSDLMKYDLPILVGASRKRFIGALTQRGNTQNRLAGSLGVAAWASLQGAHILRVHDVLETCDICRMLDILSGGEI